MKYVSLELAGRKVSAVLLDTAHKAPLPKPVTATLPGGSRGGALAAPDVTARFVAQFLKAHKLRKYAVSLLLDTDQITSVGFPHYPTPPDKLRSVVEMYAGTALPGHLGGYSIAYAARKLLHADGQNRSTIYAAPIEQVKRFYLAFRRAGVKVYSVEASGAAFSRLVVAEQNSVSISDLAPSRKQERAEARLAKTALKAKEKEKAAEKVKEQNRYKKNGEPANGTAVPAVPSDPLADVIAPAVPEPVPVEGAEAGAAVFLDFGEHSALVSVCVAGKLLFEQSFPSVYQDMADAYADVTGEDGESASDFLYNTGLDPDASIYNMHPELLRRLSMLIDVTMDDIFRTLRITFSGERTDAESLTVSGEMAKMPGLYDRIVHNSANFVAEDKLFSGMLLRLAGAASPKKPFTENLLYTYFKKQKQLATIAMIACGALLLAALIFPAQYWTRKNEITRLDKAKTRVASETYTETKLLLAEEERLAGLRAQYDRAVAQLPFDQRSQAAEYLQLLYSKSILFTTSVRVEFDNVNGVLTVDFVTRNLEIYLAWEQALVETGVFSVDVPVDLRLGGSCSGSVVVRINDFASNSAGIVETPDDSEEVLIP